MESLDGSRLGSTVDDTSLDSVLDDGIQNQSLAQNDVYHEMMSQVDLRKAAQDEQIQVRTLLSTLRFHDVSKADLPK